MRVSFVLTCSLTHCLFFILCIILIVPQNLDLKHDLSFQQVPVSLWAEMQSIESDWVSCKIVLTWQQVYIVAYICFLQGLNFLPALIHSFIIMKVHWFSGIPGRIGRETPWADGLWKSFSINLHASTETPSTYMYRRAVLEQEKTLKQTILFQSEEHVLMFCCDSTINKPFSK